MFDLVFLDNVQELGKLAKEFKAKNYLIAGEFMDANEINELVGKIRNLGLNANAKDPKLDLKGNSGERNQKLNFKICLLLTKADGKLLGKLRDKVDCIAVLGGTPELNKFAVSTKGIDLLLRPCTAEKFSFDKGLARIAAENNVKIGILFSDFLNCYGMKRAKLFRNCSMVAKLMKGFKAVPLVFSGANNIYELRAIKDLVSFGESINLGKNEIEKSAKEFGIALRK